MDTNKMTVDQSTQQKLEALLKDVTEENDLLLGQLHQVQGVLERQYLQSRELEKRQPNAVVHNVAPGKNWAHEELLDALAENSRLQALVQAQKRIHQVETENALTSKLGNILIHGADSPGSLFSVPGKIAKIWRQSGQLTPPKLLGGKSFDKVIEAYGRGGLDAAEKLLAETSVGPVMQANAYTVLARHLMNGDRANAAMAARRAYEIDPKPFRLKWLAFRLHEIGEVVEAEAMLKTLPLNTPFSESETRQANQVGYEAGQARRNETEQSSDFAARRARVEKQLTNLSRKRDEQAKLAAERGHEVEVLKQAQAQLEQQKAVLSAKHDERTKLAAERGREVEMLKQAKAQLEREKAALSEKHDEKAKLAGKRSREVEALKHAQAELEQEKAALSGKYDEQTKLAAELGHEVELLKRVQEQLEQDKAELSGKHDEQTRLAAQRVHEVEVLKHVQAQLEQEKATLSGKHGEQTKLAAERGQEVDALKEIQARLEQEKAALSGKYDEQKKLVAERDRDVEVLKDSKAKLEQEKATLSGKYDEQAKLASERSRELDGLKDARSKLEQEKAALSSKHDEQKKLVAERDREVEGLKDARSKLEQEKAALSGKHDEQRKLVAERDREVEGLKDARSKLEQEKTALSAKHDEQKKLVAERDREVEGLKDARSKLEQEKTALSGKHDEQTKLAAERGREVEALKQAKAKLEQEKTALQDGNTELREHLQAAQKLVPAKFVDALKGRLAALPDASNLPDVSLVSVEHAGKAFFFTHFSTDYIPKKMAERNQFYEATFLDLLARLHHPDKLIIDGGANIGNHSVFFAGVIGASVIAFEPQPFNHEILVANARLNHLENQIDVRNKAIGDRPGSISLVQALPGNYGSFTADTELAQRDEEVRARGLFDVQVSTIDAELKDREDGVSIIKLDLEGMELEVLHGARAVIERSLPVISVECFTRSFYAEIKEFLESFGYFALDSANATPTFIFLTRRNSRHMEMLSGYLEMSSIGKFHKNSVFNETK